MEESLLRRELSEILKRHEKWLLTDSGEGQIADRDKADLRDLDLHGKNLRGQSYVGLTLRGANLSGTSDRGGT